MGCMENKVPIITGAGSGMGRVAALRFLAEGAKVVVADITGPEEVIAKEVGASGVSVRADAPVAPRQGVPAGGGLLKSTLTRTALGLAEIGYR